MSGTFTCLCNGGLHFVHIIPHGFWQDPSTDLNGVREILQKEQSVNPGNNDYRSSKYCILLYIFPLISLTALRLSADPETRYALLTNFATVSIFIKPFHRISCLAKNRDVSSTDGDSEAIDLKHTCLKLFIGMSLDAAYMRVDFKVV